MPSDPENRKLFEKASPFVDTKHSEREIASDSEIGKLSDQEDDQFSPFVDTKHSEREMASDSEIGKLSDQEDDQFSLFVAKKSSESPKPSEPDIQYDGEIPTEIEGLAEQFIPNETEKMSLSCVSITTLNTLLSIPDERKTLESRPLVPSIPSGSAGVCIPELCVSSVS
jgi:hypothetical protein